MDCEHERIFKRLTTIAKVLIPVLMALSFIVYYYYQHSIDLLDIYIQDKSSQWKSSCTETDCVEYQVFFISGKNSGKNETLTTSEEIFYQLDVGNSYLVGTKGWSFGSTFRKLTHVY